MSNALETHALPPPRIPRWKALPGIAGYYLLGALMFPAVFVGLQVGLEWFHPMPRASTVEHQAPTQTAPDPQVLPIGSPEYLSMIRDEIDKTVRAAVTQENAPISRELASLNAKLAQIDATKFVTLSRDTAPVIDAATLEKALKMDPYILGKEKSEAMPSGDTYMNYDFNPNGQIKSNYLPPKILYMKMKNGKFVTVTSDNADALEQARQKLAVQ